MQGADRRDLRITMAIDLLNPAVTVAVRIPARIVKPNMKRAGTH